MEIRQDITGDRMAELDSSTLEGLFSLTPAQLDRWLDEHQIPVLGSRPPESPVLCQGNCRSWKEIKRKEPASQDSYIDSEVLKRKISMPRARSKREESEQRHTYASIHAKSARSSIGSTIPVMTRSKVASLLKPITAQCNSRIDLPRKKMLQSTPLASSLTGEKDDALPLLGKNNANIVNPWISSNHDEIAVKEFPKLSDPHSNSPKTDAKLPFYEPAKPSFPLGEVKENRGTREASIIKKVLIGVNSDEIVTKEKAKAKNECRKNGHHQKEGGKMRLHPREDKKIKLDKESDDTRLHHEENGSMGSCHEEDDYLGINPEEYKKDQVGMSDTNDDKMTSHEREAESEIPNKEEDGNGLDVSKIQQLKRSASLIVSSVNTRVIKRLKCVHLARRSARAVITFSLCAIVTSIGIASYMYHLKKLEEQRLQSRRWWRPG